MVATSAVFQGGDLQPTAGANPYAAVENGIVVNICLWTGNTSDWQPPTGWTMVQMTSAQQVSPGFTYDATSGTFSDPNAPTLTDAQTAKTKEIYAAYQSACYQNVSYTSQAGVAQTYQADEVSQGYVTKMLDSYAAASATPTGFYWVAADNTKVPFTFADLQGLAAAMGAQGWTAFQHLQNLKAQIAAATTVDAVNAITW